MHGRRGRSRSGLWRAAAIGLLLGAGTLGAQVLPTIEQVFELRTAAIRPGTVTATTVADLSTRLATEEELQSIALGDPDADGRPSLRDACPLNPACASFSQLFDDDGDGFPVWQDSDDQDPLVHLLGDPAIDDYPTTDPLTGPMGQVQTSEEIVDWFLEENASKNLYSQANVIQIAEQAGFDPEVVEAWRQQYLEPPPSEGCRDCLDGVSDECDAPCAGKRGREGYVCKLRCKKKRKKECKEICKAEKKDLKGAIKTVKKEIGAVLQDSRGKPPRPPAEETQSLLSPLYEKLADLVRQLWSLKW